MPLYHLTSPFRFLYFSSYFSLTLFVSHAPDLALLLSTFHVVKELSPFHGFHLTLPFLMHTLFHNHISIQMQPFLVLFFLLPHLFLSFHSVFCHETLIPFVYKLLYIPFLLSYLPNYEGHSFYMFPYIALLPLVPFRIVYAGLPLVSQFQLTFLLSI